MYSTDARSGTPKRNDRMLREEVHDPYKMRRKLSEPTVCPGCGAVFQKGRWTWGKKPEDASEQLCQACSRIEDKYPAGYVSICGTFAKEHKKEILHLVRNLEEQERGEHPLHRIMDIAKEDDRYLVTTTDIHLPRRIGDALASAYDGDMDLQYDKEGYQVRIFWNRN